MSISARMKTTAVLPDDTGDVDVNQFYSVEFAIDNIKFLYQFKIWSSPSSPMFVLVKNGSEMLDKLKSGAILTMKYYSSDAQRPTCHLDTKILGIHWNDNGRFKGHYAVRLGLIGKKRSATLSVQ
ncbi:MAG: hypothetical protein RBT11_12325 [Desulfobacterales bacterium]|jgi:hypothetical protein|nr:hypothetical protein [Desulfobacterales bacterium]